MRAPSMVGAQEGLVKLIQEKTTEIGNNSLIRYHCLNEQENQLNYIKLNYIKL